MDFHPFATKVHRRFVEMSKGELFVVGTNADDVFAHYLASFPEGSNPIYKTRTEHDCTCCKNFIRNIGRVVRINKGKVESVWDVTGLESPYKEVAASMKELIEGLPVTSLFRTKERSYGNEYTRQMIDGVVKRWDHFHGQIGATQFSATPEEAKGTFNTNAHVFLRGLEELTPSALEQVVELIQSNALYRGEEHLSAVQGFQKVQKEYLKLKDETARTLFVFSRAADPAVRFRSTVIGTLVQDLSEGKDIEEAVRMFENKVAPTNYKRTSALITPRMVSDAMKTIRDLGLEQTLERRLAHLSDISVNNVLWVDRSVKGRMKGGVEELLMTHAKSPTPSDSKATDISIDDFMRDILPTAQNIDLYLRNTHVSNFMTLTAPVHPDTGKLFKWRNDFAWSYDGNLTDSIREKVKRAGGNVDARLRFSLAWYNYDDLDIHVKQPNSVHIYFGNKGGRLDVDMNAGVGRTRQPVENVSYPQPADGVYEVWVNQFSRREPSEGIGFSIEIASASGVTQLSYKKGVSGDVAVGKFTVKDAAIIEAKYGKDIVGTGIAQDKWGLKTESMVKVQTVMFSPNYWDENAVGNKHWFFLLEACHVDGPARGIYNEFLASGLEKHRKVFEVLGDKTKCPVTEEQLSGLGFSSTRGDTVTVSVKSERSTRLFNINF